ncbi:MULTISPECIES: NAD(P)/FAD-dependent oxidoreductase [Halolamina]|uniref:NAD(P)-binding Rossmann-like domain-containing protein n=1 Tax=Halolamina pelagica TaxID=699431 RepID=A0A1I5MQ87_9EURY|nr:MULTISPECIES: FAD-dependent oxidoreductase [Halolamina]NHX36119.1 FAD-binding protein [Halolamina sp. R1-12]SFP11794.1 NAD(P)-binding Rossmann-like domain-containing protein [Halolamina pelagica]
MSDPTGTRHNDEPLHREVLIVGGGVAGLTAAVYTARAGLDTLVYDGGESILRRNAHLENFPGFPAGVNPRLFADMLHAQATRNGADLVDGRIVELQRAEIDDAPGFLAIAEDGTETYADRVIAASWADTDYLDPVGLEIRAAGSKAFLEDDEDGRTSVDGLYAAGRLAERYHQATVAAGDGARTAITLIHDSETPFYHDWVVPEGYFTDRGREVPPGCEEIDDTERAAREAESSAAMREYFAEAHGERQRTHPSLVDDEQGRVEES